MNPRKSKPHFAGTIGFVLLGLAAASSAWAQPNIGFERSRTKSMLDQVSREIEKNFYDPSLRGLEWSSLVARARQKIEQAQSVNQMFTAIFALVDKLQDSHTKFLPPQRTAKIRFGFEAKPFGEEIRIHELKKGGAAAAAGLQLGDRILSVNGFNAERSSFDLMMLYFRLLRPVAAMEMEIARGSGPPQKIVVQAKVEQGQRVNDLTQIENIYQLIREAESEKEIFRYGMHEGDIGYVQLPSFTPDEDFFNGLVGKIKKARATIVDLRGNPGGSIESLKTFVGYFEPEPTVIAEMVGRKKTEPVKVRPHRSALGGPLFILVDSESSSAAEVFARHFQRTGRAVVIGDHTAGRVTVAKFFTEQEGIDTVVLYGVQVAVGRLVFPGGEELEKKGVTPDHLCIPTGEHLREEKDPCRALAYTLARQKLGLPEKTAEDKPGEKKE